MWLIPGAPGVWGGVILAALFIHATPSPAQTGATFTQLSDLGSNTGPRLTRSVTRARISRDLFGRIGTKANFIQDGLVYQFATDPAWNRVLVGLWDQYINEYTNVGGPGGRILRPYGIDISARKFVYIADREQRRVLRTVFSPSSKNLTSPVNIYMLGSRPIDVAWDGTTAPLTNDYLYVLDDSLSRVSYWNLNSDITTPLWTYGSVGSGIGQFLRPTGVCVAKTPGGSGGTQFTTVFFVVDRGNKRVVRLFRSGTNTVTWSSTYTHANWDPADCTVDHFGQLYVTDAQGHRILKFDTWLQLLDTYGSYGTGPANLNTFNSPRAISVPCGLKVVNTTTTVWYCEGRIITAERWSENTGALEHWLGVKSQITGQPLASSQNGATVFMKATDVANLTVKVHRQNVGIVRAYPARLYAAMPGGVGFSWDGMDNLGKPVPDANYRFQITVQSPYGCPAGVYTWCTTTLNSNYFAHHYCVPDDGGGGGPGPIPIRNRPGDFALPGPPTCSNVVLASSEGVAGVPATFAVRQLPGRMDAVPAGLSLFSTNAGLQPSMSIAGVGISAQAARIAETRDAGVTALQINLPAREAVRVRIVDLEGRLIRSEHMAEIEPGALVYRWDGHDDKGQRARAGVYIAEVNAGPHMARSKLIVTRLAN
jgi:flagellar hook assembly protein FlgD